MAFSRATILQLAKFSLLSMHINLPELHCDINDLVYQLILWETKTAISATGFSVFHSYIISSIDFTPLFIKHNKYLIVELGIALQFAFGDYRNRPAPHASTLVSSTLDRLVLLVITRFHALKGCGQWSECRYRSATIDLAISFLLLLLL